MNIVFLAGETTKYINCIYTIYLFICTVACNLLNHLLCTVHINPNLVSILLNITRQYPTSVHFRFKLSDSTR